MNRAGPIQAKVDRWVLQACWLSGASIPIQVLGAMIFGYCWSHCYLSAGALFGLAVFGVGRLSAALAIGQCLRVWRAGATIPTAAAALAVLAQVI